MSVLSAFGAMLDRTDPDFEVEYLGSGFKLDVFRVYRRGSDVETGSLRCGEVRWHIVRFDLPEAMESPSPLVVSEDEDGESCSAPGWDTRQGFVDSLQLVPRVA
ncbi:hypothetical protein Poly24_36120 [Rosistilla carotiformis]|uniref:Uncharacterized protein n=1 Tax=Rosistilla carotiformis TaxID=2528017 RepID=A0A518JWH9_9BACT|nr:hypothetical protein Poly24_36120 [Rosistilla carotiformis]